MFSIVRFLDEDEVEIVPQKWWLASKNEQHQVCWYPRAGASEKIKKIVDPSDETGSWFNVKVLGNYGKSISTPSEYKFHTCSIRKHVLVIYMYVYLFIGRNLLYG